MAVILDLPLELLHEVFLYFCDCQDAPQDRTKEKTPLREFQYIQRIFMHETYPDKLTLANSRLTCRMLNFAASDMFYRHYYVTLSGWDYPTFERATKVIMNEVQGQSVINDTARKLRLDFADPGFFGHSAGHLAGLRDNMMDQIPQVLRKLPKLETLRVDIARSDSSYGCLKFDLDRVATFTSSLARGLSYANFEKLSSLYLSLLCTEDFEIISRRIPDSLCRKIQNLYLEVVDGTGPGGTDPFNRYIKDEAAWMPSNLQATSPNLRHQQGLFDLVAKCENLKSLGICATQRLNLDLLIWQHVPSSLEVLLLNRLQASSEGLKRLLQPECEQHAGRCGLKHLQFTEIELTKGTWEEVFVHLLHSSTLKYFCATHLAYDVDGESAGFRPRQGRVFDRLANAHNVHTRRDGDRDALRKLFRVLYQKVMTQSGPSAYPHNPECLSHQRLNVYA